MSYITTNDGVKIYYTNRGTGKKSIILIGGWTITTAWWKKQLEGLSQHYHVIAIDPRAYGNSQKVSHGHKMARHAADIHDILNALNLNDTTLVGWSLGANVLLAYWQLFRSERVSHFVHVDQTPFCLNTKDWHWGIQGFGDDNAAQNFCNSLATDRRKHVIALIDNWYAKLPSSDDKQWMLNEIMKTPDQAAIDVVWDHLNADWRSVVPTVNIPVMIATGRKSKIFPWNSGDWLAKNFPKPHHVIFEQSGHCPFWEEPESFNIALHDFVNTN